jgi:RNA polymerase sigma factor (sigma-70 family)
VLPEGASELGELSGRVERHDLADAHCHQPAKGLLAQPADAVLASDPDEFRGSERGQMLAKERVGQVWKAVEGLSERQRTVFLLRYVEEQELSEIARQTGLSEGTVKAHLSRALGRVRAELGGRR